MQSIIFLVLVTFIKLELSKSALKESKKRSLKKVFEDGAASVAAESSTGTWTKVYAGPNSGIPMASKKRAIAYLRGVANPRDPREALVYAYWIQVLHLLKVGMPWDAIGELAEAEVDIILGISAAFQQKEAEDEQRAMAASR